MQITVCDVCRTEENVETLTLTVGREMDAAGSMDNVHRTFDLCASHRLEFLSECISWLHYDDVRKLADKIRARIMVSGTKT